MSALDDIIAQLVTDAVVDGSTGWGSMRSFMPDSPDKIVVVFDVGGGDVDQTQGTHQFDNILFQVRVRATEQDYSAASTKMDEVFASLNNVSITGYTYIFANSIQPIPLGLDKNNRPELVMNFSAMKER